MPAKAPFAREAEDASLPAADKRTLILQATQQLLAQRGFHGFSMKQLADAAGVATGTVYLYFKDREQLIFELHETIVRRVAAEIFVGFSDDLPFRQQFQLICRNLWQFCLKNPDILMCKAQFDHLPPEALRNRKANARQFFQPISTLFAQGKAARVIKDLPDDVLFQLGMEPFMALARQHHLGLVHIDDHCLEQCLGATWQALGTGW